MKHLNDRIKKLEQALRIIRTWANCFDSDFETPRKAMDDIRDKCDEMLKDKAGDV